MPVCTVSAPKDSLMRRFPAEWRLIALLWVCYALNHADRQVVYTLFPVLKKDLAFSDTTLGLIGALFIWVYGLCSPVAGILGDRFSKARMVAMSLILWSTLTLLAGASPNGSFLLLCRALLGVSESLFFPAAYALIAAAHGSRTGSRAVAIFGTSHIVGVALGGTISGYIGEHYSWRASFWALGATGLMFAPLLIYFFRRMPPEFDDSRARKNSPGFKGFFSLLQVPTLCWITLYLGVSTFALYLVGTWLPSFLGERFHAGLARSAFAASVYPQFGSALGLFCGGWIADRYSSGFKGIRCYSLVIAMLGAGPCLFLMGMTSEFEITCLAAVAYGFFSGFGIVNQTLATFEVVPVSKRASAVGMLNLVGSTVSGFAPFLGGLTKRAIGIGRLIEYSALVSAIVGLMVLYGIYRNYATDREQADRV